MGPVSNYHARTYKAQRRRREAAQWLRFLFGYAVALGALFLFYLVLIHQDPVGLTG